MSDPVGADEIGMQRLLAHLSPAHPRYAEALTYQQRLYENLAKARQYGDTPTLQHDRAVIVAAANALAQDTDGPMLAPAPSVHTQAMRPVLGVLGDPRHIRTDGGDYAEQSMDKRQGTFYETHHHYRDAPAQPPTDRAQRVRGDLLAQLAMRYTQRLEDSLHEQVRIALDLHTSPTAVAPTGDCISTARRDPVPSHPEPRSTRSSPRRAVNCLSSVRPARGRPNCCWS